MRSVAPPAEHLPTAPVGETPPRRLRAVLVGQVGRGQAFERHPEGYILGDPAAQVEIECLLLQRPVERRLGGKPPGDLDAAVNRSFVWDDLAHHAPRERGPRVDLLAGPQQPLGARRSGDLFPHDVQAVTAGDPKRGVGRVAVRGDKRPVVAVERELLEGGREVLMGLAGERGGRNYVIPSDPVSHHATGRDPAEAARCLQR